MSEDRAERVLIKITKVDFNPGFRASFLTGKDKAGAALRFLLRPDTNLHRISPTETTQSLDEVVHRTSSLPFYVDEEVLVSWKIDPSTYQRIAVTITVLE